MQTHPWSTKEQIDRLSKEPLGKEFVRAIAKRLYHKELFMGYHRDYCGHGLDYNDGEFRLVLVSDGWVDKILHTWESEEAFVSFFARQSDYSMSGADKDEEIFYTEDSFELNNQRLVKAKLQEAIDFRYEERYIAFFKELIKPLSPNDQEKLLQNLHYYDEGIEYAIKAVLCKHSNRIMIVTGDECGYEIALQMVSVAKLLGIGEFEAKDGIRKEDFIDWVTCRGFRVFYWFVGLYDSRILVVKKGQEEQLLKRAKEADFLLLPLIASWDYPTNFITYHKQEQDDLKELLHHFATKAKELEKPLFLYISMDDCRPCAILQNSINEPVMVDAFSDVLILHLDIFEWIVEFRKLFLEISSAPLFIYVTHKGKVTEHIVDGDIWGDEDKPELMAKALKPYFADTNHPPLKITEKKR